jgi:hypothetical protein
VVIRPVDQELSYEPKLVRLDNLGPAELRAVSQCSFMTLRTGPDQYQCWLAVDRKDAAAQCIQPAEMSGPSHCFIPIAGKTRPLTGGTAGLLATSRQLGDVELRRLFSSGVCQ